MIDISGKIETLRSAIAESRVFAKKETIGRAERGETPKGDVLTTARVAAVLAAKKTAELIPYCHPLLLDSVAVDFKIRETEIVVQTTVRSIGKTGVEMEALTAASIAALTIYDMLKPIDKEVLIGETKLLEKKGGKSDFGETFLSPLKSAVLVTSDSVSAGKKADRSGKIIVEEMKRFPLDLRYYEIVPDDPAKIRQKLIGWVEEGIRLIVTTGGTGLGPRDLTVETVKGLIEREVPGIAEAIRSYGQRRTPYAMLSRGVVGVRGKSLFVTLPGSSRGVKESMAAVFPNLLHIFNMMEGGGH
ncbi:MAG: bifunctional molybdenum cofactor biosynthesis protein MoaC/MoaB [Deltaproteobacteria bacterium]|nr:bifunctional molybdenum cofactor biosynthesis protein MoaC/MoaB [Deltaproteobacteria bacterium]